MVKKKLKIFYLTPFAPRVCGIASFTQNLMMASEGMHEIESSKVVALDRGLKITYSADVMYHFSDNNINNYVKAAAFINASDVEAVSLQHEYGLYGGEMGEYIIDLIKRLKKPLVTTFHMVSPANEATEKQKKVTYQVGQASNWLVALSKSGAQNLNTVYGISEKKIEVIPHGVPDLEPSYNNDKERKMFGLNGRMVLTSVNIMRESRGVDIVLQAMPKLVSKFPNLVYLVVGRDEEVEIPTQYRQKLEKMVRDLGLEKHVIFINKYVQLEELNNILKATDFFITSYRPPEESSSGSLAYAVAAGKVCISTPYNYAKEILADGRGVIVPWLDAKAIETVITRLLKNRELMKYMGEKAYKYGRNMIWSNVAKQYVKLFIKAANEKYYK